MQIMKELQYTVINWLSNRGVFHSCLDCYCPVASTVTDHSKHAEQQHWSFCHWKTAMFVCVEQQRMFHSKTIRVNSDHCQRLGWCHLLDMQVPGQTTTGAPGTWLYSQVDVGASGVAMKCGVVWLNIAQHSRCLSWWSWAGSELELSHWPLFFHNLLLPSQFCVTRYTGMELRCLVTEAQAC